MLNLSGYLITDSIMEIPKLNDAERHASDSPLTNEECKKTFENGKSPGEDGFTVEFCEHFFSGLISKPGWSV